MKKFFMLIILIFSANCLNAQRYGNWKDQFNTTLNQYGHRNWILITDKAYPKQSSEGMKYIDTNEDLISVLKYVLISISEADHVKPVIYKDKELDFITVNQEKDIIKFRMDMEVVTKGLNINTLLHNDVFKKLDESSSMFETLILKTNTTIPYSSVFIFLDCAYWSDDKENDLRNRMK